MTHIRLGASSIVLSFLFIYLFISKFTRNVRFFLFFFFFLKEILLSSIFILLENRVCVLFFWSPKYMRIPWVISFRLNRCQNKMCRNEAFSFSFLFFIFAMTSGVYLTRVQKRLKNNSSTCSFLFFFFFFFLRFNNWA